MRQSPVRVRQCRGSASWNGPPPCCTCAQMMVICLTLPPPATGRERLAGQPAARFPNVTRTPAPVAASKAAHRISMIGPSGAGKTTLATVLLDETRRHPPDSGIRLRGADLATENWIARQIEDLHVSPVDEDPNGIQATTEPSILRLKLDLGIEPSEISIELLDAPFNMLTSPARAVMSQQVHVDCRKFAAESAILLLPIDAGLLMEAVQSEHRRALPALLDLGHVEQVVRDWAAERYRLLVEPSLITFCPVKCESYFAIMAESARVDAAI